MECIEDFLGDHFCTGMHRVEEAVDILFPEHVMSFVCKLKVVCPATPLRRAGKSVCNQKAILKWIIPHGSGRQIAREHAFKKSGRAFLAPTV